MDRAAWPVLWERRARERAAGGTLAADPVAAAKARDQAAVERQSRIWYRNANQIADFLHKANPRHWARREMRAMTRGHLDLTLAEAVAHLTRDHRADIRADAGSTARSFARMADMLSEGIVAQFPEASSSRGCRPSGLARGRASPGNGRR